MASVFLSYDHEDAGRAGPIARALETHGHEVWWDRHLHGGAEYNNEIELAVERADAVVVLWSERSVRSAWVRDEAGEGRDAGKLVPVLIEPVKPPLGFRQFQAVDLSRWNGGKRIPDLALVLDAIGKVGPKKEHAAAPPPAAAALPSSSKGRGRVTRRWMLGGSAAAAGVLAAGGAWWMTRDRSDPRAGAIVAEARQALRDGTADEGTVAKLRRAVALDPGNEAGWGLLALFEAVYATSGQPKDVANAVRIADDAAGKALALDPKEPNALLARFKLQGSALDWFTREQRIRAVIAVDPRNVEALMELLVLLQAVGMSRESRYWTERALALQPLSVDLLAFQGLKLWIAGDVPAADKVIDQARALYPDSAWLWFVRLQTYAFTGRAKAALAMVDSGSELARGLGNAEFWRAALRAIDERSGGTIARARDMSRKAAVQAAVLAGQGAQVMSFLGDLDSAFDIANGFLLSRGPLVRRGPAGAAAIADDAAWRVSTQWLFIPSTVAMRADPRFMPLCDGVGLTEYWRRRKVRPDFLRA